MWVIPVIVIALIIWLFQNPAILISLTIIPVTFGVMVLINRARRNSRGAPLWWRQLKDLYYYNQARFRLYKAKKRAIRKIRKLR